MTVDGFLDTNVLVYAAAGRGAEEAKRQRSLELFDTLQFGLSGQVLAEFFNKVTTKADVRMPHEAALAWLDTLEPFPCVAVDAGLVRIGADYAARYRISYWDGAIIAAAERLGAPILYTEDLSHGQSYGPVRVVNPFREAA